MKFEYFKFASQYFGRRYIAILFNFILLKFLISLSLPASLYAQKNDSSTSSEPALSHSQGERIKFERISLEQGLSPRIFFILQDRKGFMWFGTTNGLHKYDGYNFVVYKHNPLDSNSLSEDFIFSIFEDNSGTLWVGTYGGGLNKFDPESEIFTHYTHDPANPKSLSNNIVRVIIENKFGTLWIGTTGGGLSKFDREKDTFTHYKHDPTNPNSLSHNDVRSIYEDKSGTLWIGTRGGGLNRLVPRDNVGSPPAFIHYQNHPDNPNSLSDNHVWSIYEDSFGTLWIGTEGGINKFDRETENFTCYKQDPANPNSLSNNWVQSIYEDRSGTLWIGTNHGLNKVDRESTYDQQPLFRHYTNNLANPNSLSENQILSIYEDNTGTLWIGTMGGGVNKFDRKKQQFKHYKYDPANPHSLSHNHIWSIYEDRSGTHWIGTRGGGLNKLVPSDNEGSPPTFMHYQNDPDNPNSLSHNDVTTICEGVAGTLWIGTGGGGLNKLVRSSTLRRGSGQGSGQALSEAEGFDREKEQFIHYKHDPNNPNSLSHNNVMVTYVDKYGTLWIGTWGGGLNKLVPSSALRRGSGQGSGQALSEAEGFNPHKEQFAHYKHDPKNPHSLSDNRVWSIYEDSYGILWIGANRGGLNKFDRDKEEFTHYRHDPTNPHTLSYNRVWSIHEDKYGMLWFGTNAGLNKFDRENEIFTHFTKKDGLPSDAIYGILSDENRNLWLSTEQGLSKFNPHTETFRNYDVNDGLQSNVFTITSYHKCKSGEMFFGGINGLNFFHPDSIKDNRHIPPIVLTAFKKFNKIVRFDKAISEIDEVEFSYKDNFFSFEYAALDYTNPEKNQYAYKLEGFNEDWIYCGNRRYATYTNLDAGEYIFRVKGSNNDGVWNEDGVSVKIIITPPFWKTWWFISLSAVSLIFIGYTGYRSRLNAKLEKARFLNELQAAHDMQMGLMPKSDPVIEGFDISGICKPAEVVGGDYFDFVWLDGNCSKLAIALVDVSESAMKGAMTAVMTSGMLYGEVGVTQSPRTLLQKINRPMYLKTDRRVFTAMLIAVIDTYDKTLTLTNAGQSIPILKRNREIEYLKVNGNSLPLGLQENVEYEEMIVQLQSGDMVIFYTDGLPEAMNDKNELFDFHRLETATRNLPSKIRAAEVVKTLLGEVESFASSGRSHDDITLVVMRVE